MKLRVYAWDLTPRQTGEFRPSVTFSIQTETLDELMKAIKLDKSTRQKVMRRVKKLRMLAEEEHRLSESINNKIKDWCKKSGVKLIVWEERLRARRDKIQHVIVAEVEKAGIRSRITLGTKDRLPELPKMLEQVRNIKDKIDKIRFEVEGLLKEALDKYTERLGEASNVDIVIRVRSGKIRSFKVIMK